MNDAAPLVSIVMPVYNRSSMVREAIDSALADAPNVPLEIVVVDDASTDDTFEVVRSYPPPVRALRMERNGGQSRARNRGLDEARGAYVKFLDSDDLLLAGHLEAEVRAMREASADIAASGWIATTDGVPTQTFEAPRFDSIPDDILAGVAAPTSAALYERRADWRWDPELRKLDDWDYFCQAALGARNIVTVAGASYAMRHHGGARATDASLVANAREHHRILQKIEERLAAEERLTAARKRRLAQYYYKEMRVLSLGDRDAFEAAARHIRELDPAFVPREEERQWFMRAASRLVGFRNAILLHGAIKKALK